MYQMMGKGITGPILDHIRLLLQNSEPRGSMIHMIPHLNLQSSSLTHNAQIVWLDPQRILHAFGRLKEVLSLLVDGAACMPTKQTLHLALQEGQLCHVQCLRLFVKREQEKSLQGVSLGMVGMHLQ